MVENGIVYSNGVCMLTAAAGNGISTKSVKFKKLIIGDKFSAIAKSNGAISLINMNNIIELSIRPGARLEGKVEL